MAFPDRHAPFLSMMILDITSLSVSRSQSIGKIDQDIDQETSIFYRFLYDRFAISSLNSELTQKGVFVDTSISRDLI